MYHLLTALFNLFELVVWIRSLDLLEDVEDLIILILHVYKPQLLALVLANELVQLLAVLNLVQTLHELVRKSLDPFNVLFFDLEEGIANLSLPLGNDVYIWRVLFDRLGSVVLDRLILLHLLLVLLVDVVQVFLGHQALETLVFLQSTRPESCRGIMLLTIDPEGTVGELLLRVVQEGVVDNLLTHVTFHVLGRLLFFFVVDET